MTNTPRHEVIDQADCPCRDKQQARLPHAAARGRVDTAITPVTGFTFAEVDGSCVHLTTSLPTIGLRGTQVKSVSS